MITVDKGALKFLLDGRPIDVTVPREHRKGRIYSLGTRHNHTICRVQVLRSQQTPTGWQLQIKRLSGDEIILFTYGGGTVRALVEQNPDDPDVLRGGNHHEPEPVDDATQQRLSADGTLRWAQEFTLRENRRARMALAERLHDLERQQGRGNLDVSRQIAAIRRHLKALQDATAAA